MLSEIETGIGLDVVIWLQSHSNILLERLAQALNWAGTVYFYFPAILIIALFWDRRIAWRLAVAVVVSTVASELLKRLLGTPRPFQVDPEHVTVLFREPGSHGLPSGHVTNALVFWGMIAVWLRQTRVWIAVACYVALIGWSRMVGGVHYPQDVVAGLLLGSVVLLGFVRLVIHWPRQYDFSRN